jgi:rubrerythrin
MTKKIEASATKTTSAGVSSRRGWMLGAGAVGAVLAARNANAQAETPVTNSDVSVLNYALTLEHLEAAFYTQGLARFRATDFSNATFAGVFGSGTVNGVYTNLGRIRDHEVAHVQALQTAIGNLGGTPVQPCTYTFPYSTPEQFLQVAVSLEETGVAAYNGALALLQSAALKAAGASIATVEGRHAAYLQLLNTAIPFPKSFDDAKMMREILAIASAFITSCGTTQVGMNTTAMLTPRTSTVFDRQLQFDASQSLSANGQPLAYELRSVSGAAAIISANTSRPVVQFSGGPGDYTFELIVTDTTGAQSRDRVTITYRGQ